MSSISHVHHQIIYRALDNLNIDFLKKNNILFGGGTRISLELHEYRLSVDIDFLCPNKESYRAVRQEVSNVSLGDIVRTEFVYPRDINIDRDAIRCFILIEETPIKLEIVAFDDYQLTPSTGSFFDVPYIDETSCYVTKLLANSDRYSKKPYKDIFDLLVMYDYWGGIPYESWIEADAHYGITVVKNALIKAYSDITKNPNKYLEIATDELYINEDYSKKIISEITPSFIEYFNKINWSSMPL